MKDCQMNKWWEDVNKLTKVIKSLLWEYEMNYNEFVQLVRVRV